MNAALLNNQSVVVMAPAPAATGTRREVGHMLMTVNTAFNREIDLVDAAGAPVTGSTLTITLSKDGGAHSGITPTVTERGNGAYVLAFTAAHNDTVGSHVKRITGTGGVVPIFVYDQVVLEVLDGAVEGSVTLRQSQRLQNAAAAGKVSGMGTNNVIVRDLADLKNRIAADVDVIGNRTAVTKDLT